MREADWFEYPRVQDFSVSFRDWFFRLKHFPVIGVKRRAEKGKAAVAVRIKGREGAVHNDEGNFSEFPGKLDQDLFRHLELDPVEEPHMVAAGAVGGVHHAVVEALVL